MDSWIWQAGYPLVTASVVGDELVLAQRRFSFAPDDAGTTIWVVPVHVSQRVDDDTETTKVLLESDEVRVPLRAADAVVVVNAGGPGFFRVAYDDSLRSAARRRRARPAHDAGAVQPRRRCLGRRRRRPTHGGRVPRRRGLATSEISPCGRSWPRGWRLWASRRRAALDAFRARVRALASAPLARLSWDPAPDEDDLTAKLRGLLVGLVAVLGGDGAATTRARGLFERSLEQPDSIDPELVAAATSVVASTGDAADFDRFVEIFRHPSTPQEQLRALYSLAEFDDAALVARAVEFALGGEVKTQNAPFLIGRCIANRNHGQSAWKLLRERWAEANERFPTNTIVRMVDPVKLLNTPAAAADVQAFFAEHPIVQAVQTLNQVLERQRVNVALRSREEAAFGEALTS
ncbi:MAG: ERAP1-like C-terminal domain-containing protein [Ilumatobacteraceae bacterium]